MWRCASSVATVWLGMVACDGDIDGQDGLGTPPLADAELAGCEATGTTRVLGTAVEVERWSYDRDGRRQAVVYDDEADDDDDRLHIDTWEGDDLVKIASGENSKGLYLETRDVRAGVLVSSRISTVEDVEGGAVLRTDVLAEYHYERGLLDAVDYDLGADGSVDERLTYRWTDELDEHVERSDARVTTRYFDAWGRLTEQEEVSTPPGSTSGTLGVDEEVVATQFSYRADEPGWLDAVYVDLGGDGSIEATQEWQYACR